MRVDQHEFPEAALLWRSVAGIVADKNNVNLRKLNLREKLTSVVISLTSGSLKSPNPLRPRAPGPSFSSVTLSIICTFLVFFFLPEVISRASAISAIRAAVLGVGVGSGS